ncbi:putative ribonuclease H-like domain-containing protein [Tanacetum coccineum]
MRSGSHSNVGCKKSCQSSKYGSDLGTFRPVVLRYDMFGIVDPDLQNKFPDKVYKVEKALYGLHQAPRAWYKTLSTYLLENGYRRGTIDKTLFIKKDRAYDAQEIPDEFYGGAQFLLRVANTKHSNKTNKALLKYEEAEDVDVHLYRSMIGSLMYLTASRPDIMFVVCACARDLPFDLEAFFDSDYVGASLDRKSTIGDETVYKEWKDEMERAATTASSLEAEQDSGNINRTQSMATLNESFPQGTDSGSGPRIGVDTARHKLNTVSIKLVLPGIS